MSGPPENAHTTEDPVLAVGKGPADGSNGEPGCAVSTGDGAGFDADAKYSWQFSLKKLNEDIAKMDVTTLSFGEIVSYELEVLKYSFLPMLCVLAGLAVLLLPLYQYATDEAIPTLLAEGFVVDAVKTAELGLCPGNADPDDCLDPRFTMTYGVQEQFGQLYDGALPRVPPYLYLTMVCVPVVFFTMNHVVVVACGGPLGTNPDGTQSSHTDVRGAHDLVKWVSIVGCAVFTVAQSAKAVGAISSKLGSLVGIIALLCAFYMCDRRIVRAGDGDRYMVKAYIYAGLFAGGCAIVTNQMLLKKLTSQLHLCFLWLVWVVIGEASLGYFRLCVRRLDLRKCDTHVAFMLSTAPCATINTNKRIPLLCLTDPLYITVMIVFCFVVEVASRITVVARDELFDRYVRRMTKEQAVAWKDSLHRQVYIHNEMLQEVFELIYPIPLAIMLYLIQFSPTGEAVDLATIAVNCLLQVVIEFFADATAIWYGSMYQSKFYRVASANMWNPYRFKLLCFLISTSAFGINGFFLYTYLRVGQTHQGDYVTLI